MDEEVQRGGGDTSAEERAGGESGRCLRKNYHFSALNCTA
eukprot:CAMPEP_0113239692 /NCGR_PEP_ID=MMETSP0008_2-20120614/5857_1 /TAXON_ID=97485 /ORGANISM="Prymnesium parvum" /LENGTH=39 /DNA_ID=CAMNT_0000086967 /DNA_START=135 /DNA_END=251 /DNA_ORIENTATION=- /assembly_acc=CAM_ASM_000153